VSEHRARDRLQALVLLCDALAAQIGAALDEPGAGREAALTLLLGQVRDELERGAAAAVGRPTADPGTDPEEDLAGGGGTPPSAAPHRVPASGRGATPVPRGQRTGSPLAASAIVPAPAQADNAGTAGGCRRCQAAVGPSDPTWPRCPCCGHRADKGPLGCDCPACAERDRTALEEAHAALVEAELHDDLPVGRHVLAADREAWANALVRLKVRAEALIGERTARLRAERGAYLRAPDGESAWLRAVAAHAAWRARVLGVVRRAEERLRALRRPPEAQRGWRALRSEFRAGPPGALVRMRRPRTEAEQKPGPADRPG
jgi:hypothetical protein